MSDTSRLNTLDVVVRKALEYSSADESQYDIFTQYAIDGLIRLRSGVVKEGCSVIKVTPNAINRISFPQDMIEFKALGVPVGGKIYILSERNDIIATYTEGEGGELSLDATDGEGVDIPTTQYQGINATGGYNLHGYYKVDWENHVIIINSTSRSELLLFYTTSGVDTQVTTYIPVKSVDALIAYILWVSKRYDSRIPISERQYFELEFLKAEKKLVKNGMFSAHEFRDVWTRSNSLLRV